MSSFDAFQEPMGDRAYRDPLADADRGAVEIDGLEPGDVGVSEDLSGVEEALMEERLQHRPADPGRDVSADQEESAAPPAQRMTGGSGGGGW